MISVIVPVFNSEKFLARCLGSILKQTYKGIEVICIDDGSGDSSWEILCKFQQMDSRVIIHRKENGGMSSARNVGLNIAKGEYIGFVDSDDYVQPDMFETLLKIIEEDHVDLVCCGTNIVYDAWSALGTRDENYFHIGNERNKKLKAGDPRRINACVWNKLFRSNVIKRYSLRFPEGLWYEDAAFVWCYLSISSTVSFTGEKLYNYVRYPSSIMGKTFSKNKMAIDHIRISRVVYEFLSNNHKLVTYKKDFLFFSAQNILLALYYLPLSKKTEAIKESCFFFRELGMTDSFKIGLAIIKKIFFKITSKFKI